MLRGRRKPGKCNEREQNRFLSKLLHTNSPVGDFRQQNLFSNQLLTVHIKPKNSFHCMKN